MDVAKHPNDVIFEGDSLVIVCFVGGNHNVIDFPELFLDVADVVGAATRFERCAREMVR